MGRCLEVRCFGEIKGRREVSLSPLDRLALNSAVATSMCARAGVLLDSIGWDLETDE